VDRKTDDELYRQMVRPLDNLPNVHFLKRQDVHWGHFSVVNATIQGLKEIFDRNIPFDYVVFLTGQDYPIKPNVYIESTLRKNKPNSFMLHFPIPSIIWRDDGEDDGGLERIEAWHFRLFGRTFGFPVKRSCDSRIASVLWSALIFLFPMKRRFPKGFKPFGGSFHFYLSRSCAEYVTNFVQQNRTFVNFFKYVAAPSEIFFHTIVLNSPFASSVINDDLKYIKWPYNSDHPAVLRKGDFDTIASSSSLFARKFDSAIDADILDMIDQRLLNE
jgi:hypothetical protein